MGRKISDGKAVKVAVPASTVITQNEFYLIAGFLGLSVQSLETDADGKVIKYRGETVPAGVVAAEITLNIEEGEYETKQIKTDDTFAEGTKIYWDATNKRFTTTATNNRFAGIVTWADNTADVIWFKFMPDSAEPASALSTVVHEVTFTLNGSLDTNHKVDGFKFNTAVTIRKIKARVETLPGATHALDFNVKKGAAALFTANCSIASTDTVFTFKEFTPNQNQNFGTNDVLSLVITDAGNTAAADMEIIIEYEEKV